MLVDTLLCEMRRYETFYSEKFSFFVNYFLLISIFLEIQKKHIQNQHFCKNNKYNTRRVLLKLTLYTFCMHRHFTRASCNFEKSQ